MYKLKKHQTMLNVFKIYCEVAQKFYRASLNSRHSGELYSSCV